MTTPIFAAVLPKPSTVSSTACTQWLRPFSGALGVVPCSPGKVPESTPVRMAAKISAKKACTRSRVIRITMAARLRLSTASGHKPVTPPEGAARPSMLGNGLMGR